MRALAFLLMLLLAAPVLAQPGDYSARVPVADQTAATRDAALRNALREVLGRVSGEPQSADLLPILPRAAALVQQYSYETGEAGLELVAAFDGRAVDKALREQGLPVWGVYAGIVQEIRVSVSGVQDAAGYARALTQLRSQPGVKSLAVSAVHGARLELRMRVEGGADRLAGALSVGRVLARDAYPANGEDLALQLLN